MNRRSRAGRRDARRDRPTGAGLHRGGLAAVVRVADDDGAGLPGDVLGLVLAAVVDDEDEVDMGDRAGGPDGGGDHRGLVLGGDDDGNALLAPVAALRSHVFSLAMRAGPRLVATLSAG